MRRVLAMSVTAALLMAAGCGSKSYEVRLNKTLEDMRYRKRLDDNLMPAPTKGKFEELLIFVRPPKNLQQTKTFMLGTPEPGQFDLDASFDEPQKQSMHLLARVKRPKAPDSKTKKAEAAPTNRGDFNRDVLALLNNYYGTQDLTVEKFKEETHMTNKFKRHVFSANNKNVQVYLYGPKGDPYEVAFVFEFPSSEQATLISKIGLCLESFATGQKARRAFAGTGAAEEGTERGSGGGVAF
jgi:hypothetical protein